jgi:hypothetical protein
MPCLWAGVREDRAHELGASSGDGMEDQFCGTSTTLSALSHISKETRLTRSMLFAGTLTRRCRRSQTSQNVGPQRAPQNSDEPWGG